MQEGLDLRKQCLSGVLHRILLDSFQQEAHTFTNQRAGIHAQSENVSAVDLQIFRIKLDLIVGMDQTAQDEKRRNCLRGFSAYSHYNIINQKSG